MCSKYTKCKSDFVCVCGGGGVCVLLILRAASAEIKYVNMHQEQGSNLKGKAAKAIVSMPFDFTLVMP